MKTKETKLHESSPVTEKVQRVQLVQRGEGKLSPPRISAQTFLAGALDKKPGSAWTAHDFPFRVLMRPPVAVPGGNWEAKHHTRMGNSLLNVFQNELASGAICEYKIDTRRPKRVLSGIRQAILA